MVQTIVNDTEIEFTILESEILDIVKTPGVSGEVRDIHPDIEIGNGDVCEAESQKGVAIVFSTAANEDAGVSIEYSLFDKLKESFLIMIDHCSQPRTVRRMVLEEVAEIQGTPIEAMSQGRAQSPAFAFRH